MSLFILFWLRCAKTRQKLRSRPYQHHQDAYEDEGDFYIVKKPKRQKTKKSKIKQNKKKITVEVQDYGDESHQNDDDREVEYDEASEEEELYQQRYRPTQSPRGRYYLHRPYHRNRSHYKKRNRVIRKKLSWDRKSQYDPYLSGDEEDAVSSEEEITDDEYQDHNRRRFANRRTTGVNFPNRPTFNQDLSERLDRNYGAFFGTNSPSIQGVHHRNVPTDYFSREQLDDELEPSHSDQFQRRVDMIPEDDQAFGRSLGGDAPLLDFQTIQKHKSNATADSGDRVSGNRRNGKEKAVFEMPGRFRRVYSKWSKWSKCSAKCVTKRLK